MRNVSVPWGVSDPQHQTSPHLLAIGGRLDQQDLLLRVGAELNIVWVELDKINLGPGSGIRAVAVENNYAIISSIDDQLAPTKPITFLAPTAENTPNRVPPGRA